MFHFPSFTAQRSNALISWKNKSVERLGCIAPRKCALVSRDNFKIILFLLLKIPADCCYIIVFSKVNFDRGMLISVIRQINKLAL